MRCPRCTTESSGAFCPACGAPLAGVRCAACAQELPAGARFCVQCGHPVRPAASNLPWYIAGAALLFAIVVLLLPAFGAGRGPAVTNATGFRPAAGAAAAPGSPPPLTGSPREQADRLFNRVMEEFGRGDSARAAFFLPMAIAAYRQAGPLDNDALYHLSLLEAAAGEAAAARATAELVLAGSSDHLLALAAAAQAARAIGEDAAARRYYERLLAAYERERERALPEYGDHALMLPAYRDEARAFLGR